MLPSVSASMLKALAYCRMLPNFRRALPQRSISGKVAELVRDVELLADKLAGLADDERDAADAVPESFEEQREMMEELADIISDAAESLHDATAEEKPYKMAAAIRDIIGDLETTDGIA